MAKKLVLPKVRKSPVTHIENHIREHVIGQDRPIREIARAMERAYAGLKDPERPVATLAFFGPTGSGKTLATKVLATSWRTHKVWQCRRFKECDFQVTEEDKDKGTRVPPICPLHKQERNFDIPVDETEIPNIWIIDCANLSGSLEHAMTTLMGSPPSYVGNDIPPRLAGGKAPRVVVFDEAEKALLTQNWKGGQSTFANILLKILDEGRITNNRNEEVDFRNSIIILTGNLGAAEILQEFEGRRLGYRTGGTRRDISKMTDKEVMEINQRIYQVVKEKAKREFAPEFLNRLDRLVVFHFLTRSDYDQILDLELAEFQNRINANEKPKPQFVVTYTPKARTALLDESMSNRSLGARTLKRVIEKRIVTRISEFLNEDLIRDGDHLEARVRKERRPEGKFEKTVVFYRMDQDESRLLLSPQEEGKGSE
ncbi:MAG: hypothetical protein BMS9Abin34_158 [Patescibacteria group bacterium]|nr:MAG: hypothetical protein BMS9Abin34_158 [Patescibacteria group bacterium]